MERFTYLRNNSDTYCCCARDGLFIPDPCLHSLGSKLPASHTLVLNVLEANLDHRRVTIGA